jgi:predicted regulator of Ras-like GTPase activity (Roadblock/LC7/MglB family)
MAQKTLDEVLKDLSSEATGFIAASVVGMDGFNLAQYSQFSKVNPENISAEMMLLLKLVETSVRRLNAGEVEDNLLSTRDAFVLMKFLPGKDYCLCIAVNRKTGNLGNLKLVSKIYLERLIQAIPHA